jgi:hypothetical protein
MRLPLVALVVVVVGLACDDPAEPTPPDPPGIAALHPDSALVGDTAFTLTVQGSSFTQGAVIRWADSALTTTYVSATKLTAQIPEAAIAVADTVEVSVYDGSTELGSEARAFAITVPRFRSCAAGGGTEHAGDIEEPTVWRAAHGPHYLTATVEARDTLWIQPGTRVCAEAGAELRVKLLIARGTSTDSIVFTATNPDRPWGGIHVQWVPGPDFSERISAISHARIEYAEVGVVARGIATIDSSLSRQIQRSGAYFWYYPENRLAHTVVDSAALSGDAAVGVEAGVLDHVVVRNSGGDGVFLYRYGGFVIDGGRIEQATATTGSSSSPAPPVPRCRRGRCRGIPPRTSTRYG